jgi:DNA-binding NtrC family response regulator
VQRAFVLCDDEIGLDALPVARAEPFLPAASPGLQMKAGGSIAAAERQMILATLEMQHGDKRKAAAVLGISLKTLYNRLGVYRAAGAIRDD